MIQKNELFWDYFGGFRKRETKMYRQVYLSCYSAQVKVVQLMFISKMHDFFLKLFNNNDHNKKRMI